MRFSYPKNPEGFLRQMMDDITFEEARKKKKEKNKKSNPIVWFFKKVEEIWNVITFRCFTKKS